MYFMEVKSLYLHLSSAASIFLWLRRRRTPRRVALFLSFFSVPEPLSFACMLLLYTRVFLCVVDVHVRKKNMNKASLCTWSCIWTEQKSISFRFSIIPQDFVEFNQTFGLFSFWRFRQKLRQPCSTLVLVRHVLYMAIGGLCYQLSCMIVPMPCG